MISRKLIVLGSLLSFFCARAYALSELELQMQREELRQKIQSRVKNELNRQLYSKMENHARREVYSDSKNKLDDKILFIYKVPKWPRQAQVFLKKDLIGVDVQCKFATQAYGSSGSTKDISNLVFQEGAFRVKDVLLASKLIDEGFGEVVTSKYKFLEILKDQILSFDASTESQEVTFSYIRHFSKGDISLGLQVPFVRRENKIRFTSCLTPSQNEQLQSESTNFFTLYPNGLIDFFKDMLSRKNIEFNEKDSEFGVGDVTLFANYEIPTKHCERCFTGIRLLFPTSRRRDIYKLWDPELGNGGFSELSLYGSVLFGKSRFFNPHCFVQGTYAFPATVFRRVPKTTSDSDIENVNSAKVKFGDDFMIYGNGVKYASTEPSFSEFDATVRRFSDCARKTKINKGGNVFVRMGNMFERVFSEKLFFDFFYDLHAKWRDYVGFIPEGDVYDPSILAENTYKIDHKIGANLSLQPDDVWRFNLGAMYTFAGRNTLREYEIDFGMSLQF